MAPDKPRSLDGLRRDLCDRFSKAGIESAALDARLIVQHALHLSHEQLIGLGGRAISDEELAEVEKLAQRRLDREPVSRIVGKREFFGREFEINPDVLDPRADTETLIEQALAAAAHIDEADCDLRIADVGSGSGAIIVTLLAELSGATGAAVDISRSALRVARCNAIRHGVLDRLDLVEMSWLSEMQQLFDIIVSNPPYIESGEFANLAPEVRDFDPGLALDGGVDGLAAYRALVPQATRCLKPGGCLILEVGAGQHEDVLNLMKLAGLGACEAVPAFRKDLSGIIRVVTGWKSKSDDATPVLLSEMTSPGSSGP